MQEYRQVQMVIEQIHANILWLRNHEEEGGGRLVNRTPEKFKFNQHRLKDQLKLYMGSQRSISLAALLSIDFY